jgi:hypothetical protein
MSGHGGNDRHQCPNKNDEANKRDARDEDGSRREQYGLSHVYAFSLTLATGDVKLTPRSETTPFGLIRGSTSSFAGTT